MTIATTQTPEASTAPVGERSLSVRWILPAHLLGIALVQSTGFAVMFILPVLARKHFGANDWQTLIMTAAPTVLFSLSIFWNDFFGRSGFGRYLLVYWVVGCLPMALMSFAHGYWWLAVCHIVASIGGAGYPPAAGELLKTLYPDRLRGRVYGVVWGFMLLVGAGAGYAVGKLLERDPESFRVYMPIAAGLQLAGVGILVWLAHATGHSGRREIKSHERGRWARLVEPVAHMKTILKQDPVFARYEAAYMTYGVGWMICYALLPIIVTDKLHLAYDTVAESTHVAYLLAMVAMIFPAGWLMDRLGPIRSTGLSFLLLTLYPLGLMWAGNAFDLTIVSIVFGIAHAGASVGWMLGPVSLAPSQDKVAKYVAIHATLVGIRGKVFQGLGVGLYALTGSFAVPLVIAAGAHVWSAWQMRALERRMRGDRRTATGEKEGGQMGQMGAEGAKKSGEVARRGG